MIKEKFLEFLLWFKDHFRFLLEVVVRLSVGIRKETSKPSETEEEHEDSSKGDSL